MASRLSPADTGLQLLENAAATTAALIGLILTFAAVSGAHFNPIVTLVDRLNGTITTGDTVAYIGVQLAGACVGAIVANAMFGRPTFEVAHHVRSSGALWLSEAVATFALLLIINGCVRTGRSASVPYAVGLWIGGAYFFTSSTSIANPAATVGRMFSDSFSGIAPRSAPMFVAMQAAGGLTAFAFVRFVFRDPPTARPDA
ncbi:MAG: major intrinsic protein [Ilumatobacteraceae bacterium]|nr:major intrinsic protein [Ilumatobacteraceae bacterium]